MHREPHKYKQQERNIIWVRILWTVRKALDKLSVLISELENKSDGVVKGILLVDEDGSGRIHYKKLVDLLKISYKSELDVNVMVLYKIGYSQLLFLTFERSINSIYRIRSTVVYDIKERKGKIKNKTSWKHIFQ